MGRSTIQGLYAWYSLWTRAYLTSVLFQSIRWARGDNRGLLFHERSIWYWLSCQSWQNLSNHLQKLQCCGSLRMHLYVEIIIYLQNFFSLWRLLYPSYQMVQHHEIRKLQKRDHRAKGANNSWVQRENSEKDDAPQTPVRQKAIKKSWFQLAQVQRRL